MGKTLKGLLALAAVLLLGALAAFTYFDLNWRPRFPATPLPAIAASQDPEVIAAGRYLVHSVAHCTFCHVPREEMVGSMPETTAAFLPTGGNHWDLGPIGIIRSVNITPDKATGIGEWSDPEVARAIRYGIDPQGRALLYMIAVGPMDDRDLQAIVSYLRSLSPVTKATVPSEISLEGKFALRDQMPGLIQPKPQFPVTYAPPGEVSVARGAYLANGPAMCFNCHSTVNLAPTLYVDGPRFAGSLFPEIDPENPALEINAPNLTPSTAYGAITAWTEEQFVARFKAGRAIKHSTMPWENFRMMTETDLASLFRYLKSLEPVDRNVGPSYRPVGWQSPPG